MASGDYWQELAQKNRQGALDQGNGLQSQFGGAYGNYTGRENDFNNQAYSAYSDLAANPGYTSSEASGIEGNPGSVFDHYNPEELQGTVNQTTGTLNNQANEYAGDLNTNVANLKSGLNNAAASGSAALSAVPGQQIGYQSNLYGWQNDQNNANLGSYAGDLNNSIDPSKLTVSDQFANEYKMSPEEIQNIKDVAGNTVKGQYDKMNQQSGIEAAAQGNTSPAAMAAIRANLDKQGAVDAGTAMSQAELQANSEAAQRAMNLEQTQLGANQTLAGMKQTNANNLYGAREGAAQNLSNLEMGGINNWAGNAEGAAAQGANLGYSAASEGGEAGLGATTAGANAKMGATQYGGNLATGVGEYNTSTGMGGSEYADTNAANRAGTVANARLNSQYQNLGYLTGEQGMAQQGQSTAGSQQNQAYGTEYGNANQSTSIGSNNQTTNRGQTVGMTNGLINDFFADGGVIDKPTIGVIGERGPEMVIPLGKEKARRYRMAEAA